MDYAAVVVTMLGSLLIARKSWWGYIFFLVANALWIPWSLIERHPSVTAMNVFYLCINIYGIRNWRKKVSHA